MLTTRGRVLSVGAAGAALSGLVYGVEEFVLLAIAVAALLGAGSGWAVMRVRACQRNAGVVTSLPEAEIGAGQVAEAEITLTNTGTRRLPPMLVAVADANWALSHPGLSEGALAARRRAAELAQRPRPARGFAEASDRRSRPERARDRRAVASARSVPALAPGDHAATTLPVPSGRRGVLTLSGVSVWCLDPFGLTTRKVAVAPPAHVIVYPELTTTAGHRPMSGPRPGRQPLAGTVTATHALSGDELSGLRPYAPGDRLTRLHWPSVARAGELLVREFVEPDSGSLSLLVDLRPSSHSGDTFERAITHAAGVGADALARGVAVELCTSAGDRLAITAGRAGRQTLLRALALLGPTAAPSGAARRWGSSHAEGAVWAAPSAGLAATGAGPTARHAAMAGGRAPVPGVAAGLAGDVVYVTTTAGAHEDVLPDALRPRADTVVIR